MATNKDIKEMLNKIYNELGEIRIQTTKTNGRVNRAETDIKDLKIDNCEVWKSINEANKNNAEKMGQLYEWEKGMDDFKRDLKAEVSRTINKQTPDYRMSVIGNVGASGITGILLVIIMKLIGVF